MIGRLKKVSTELTLIGVGIIVLSFSAGVAVGTHLSSQVLGVKTEQISVVEEATKERPLLAYTIPQLQTREYQVSELSVDKILGEFPEYTAYLFSYKTHGKKMTGQLNVPKEKKESYPVLLLIRGYVEQEKYTTGEGTRPAAAAFAKAGYVTFAPDFFGFGGSDPESPGWESRFEKPINVVELIRSIRQHSELKLKKDIQVRISPEKMGIWAHSNGGQITLSTLEILGESVPATLWAPVTAPFPYSILYFSDELEDEGKSMRSSVAGLEQEYDVTQFSLTQYLDRLRGPIQLHHGTADDAAPKTWSDEFVQKINKENERREVARIEEEKAFLLEQAKEKALAEQQAASGSAEVTQTLSTAVKPQNALLLPIDLKYFVYPGGNHSMRPGWDTAIERDLEFFAKHLK